MIESKIYKRKIDFPRYHQLSVVREINKKVLEVGVGKIILFNTQQDREKVIYRLAFLSFVKFA